jgi:phosphoribosylglycinamide formyltransferase 2
LAIAEIKLENVGASAVILASADSQNPSYAGIEDIAALPDTDFRIFGKPTSRPYRRMGVALVNAELVTQVEDVVESAKQAAKLVTVNP